MDGEQHRVILQDLPTVVESYKTLDDANLVKVADIGQVGPYLCLLFYFLPCCACAGSALTLATPLAASLPVTAR